MLDPVPPKLVWVDTEKKLLEVLPVLQRESSLSIDTESNSLFVYRERVCLIQISIPGYDLLIDSLALRDLSLLAGIFANKNQQKIFHASEYDVICLKRDFGFEFANLFDTMIAARILGEEGVGLASLLKSRLGIDLDKKYQRANWGLRPLPSAMLDYASQDSRYLFPLSRVLEDELHQKGLRELAQEDFQLACGVSGHPANSQPNNCWKVAGGNAINAREAAILQELCAFREKEAQSRDLPLFKVFSNELLVNITRSQPATLADLKAVRGIGERQVHRYGVDILQAIQTGLNAPPMKRPRKARPDENYLRRFDALRDWRREKGKELKVESDVVLPRDFVEAIAAENPKTGRDLLKVMHETPWRYQHYGKEILSMLKKLEAE